MLEQIIESVQKEEKVHIGKSIIRYAKIGKNSRIWHFCNIYGTENFPVIIGQYSQIGSYSEIRPGVIIGQHCRLQPFIFIPEGIKIGNAVFIGPRVTFTNDKYPTARAAIEGTWKKEYTEIKDEVSIGAGAVIGPGITLEKGSIIGMGSIVLKSIPEYGIVVGNPAKIVGDARDPKYFQKFSLNEKHET